MLHTLAFFIVEDSLSFDLSPLAIVLFVSPRFTMYYYLFGIFTLLFLPPHDSINVVLDSR